MITVIGTIIVTLLVVGAFLWALEKFPWFSPDVKQAIRVLVILIAVLWVITVLFPGLTPVKVTK